MKRYIFLAAVSALSTSVQAITPKNVCDQLKPVVADIQKQVPMAVDYMTTLTGAQAIYAAEQCMLNYNYVVNADSLIADMMQANDLSKEENLAFLQTEEGLNTMKSVFGDIAKNAASAHFQPFANIKGISITYSYSFDNPKIPSVVAPVMKN